MNQDSCSSEKLQDEKKMMLEDLLLVEQVEFLLPYSAMLESLKQTATYLTSVGVDPQTIELLNSTRYSLVKTILLRRLNELILTSLSLSATLRQCSVADTVSTLIEELSSRASAPQQEDLS